MSNNYHLRCHGCGDTSEHYNHADEDLAAAVRTCYPLHLLATSGGEWDLSSVEYKWLNVGRFLAAHFTHGGFWVVSEYVRWEEREKETQYPPVFVRPDLPPKDYAALCLPGLVGEGERVAARLAEALREARGG